MLRQEGNKQMVIEISTKMFRVGYRPSHMFVMHLSMEALGKTIHLPIIVKINKSVATADVP